MDILLPLIAALLYPLASLLLKRAMQLGVSALACQAIFAFSLALVSLPLLSLIDGIPEMSTWGWVALSTVFLVVAQWVTIMAVRAGDVSVQTPLMGSKLVMVALLASALGVDQLSWLGWVGVFIAVPAIFVITGGSLSAWKKSRLTVILALIACAMFAVSDVVSAAKAASLGVAAFVFLQGLMHLPFGLALTSTGLKQSVNAQPGAWWFALGGGFGLGLQSLCIGWGLCRYANATEANMIYSTRGLWGVLLVLAIGHWFGNAEAREAAPGVMRIRLIGAVLLIAAVGLVLTNPVLPK